MAKQMAIKQDFQLNLKKKVTMPTHAPIENAKSIFDQPSINVQRRYAFDVF